MRETDGREIKAPANGSESGARPEANGRVEQEQAVEDRQQARPQNQGEQPKPKDEKAKDSNQTEKKPFWKRPILLSVMILVALIAIVVGVIYFIHSQHFVNTDDAFIDGRISHIAPRVAGKVLELKIDDNEIVAADQPLILIDPEPYKVQLHQAEAALLQAQAQYQQAIANLTVAKANALQADADVIVAQASAVNAHQDFVRFNTVDPAARTQQQLDTATANVRSADAQVTAAQKKADSMHAMVTVSEKTKDGSAASVQAAQAQLEQAQLNLSYCTVVPGHAGRVTRRSVEVGNYVAVGQEIMDVVGTSIPQDIWVTANFKETQLKKMEKGQPVTISIDAFPDDKLHGHVDSIQNGTGSVFSLLPAENATGNYVKVVQRIPVKIVLDEQPKHLISPGMSVTPEVDVRQHQQAGNGIDSNASNSPSSR